MKNKSLKVSYNPKSKYAVSLRKITKFYGNKNVLFLEELKIKKGERVTIAGHNGSGKSTLSEIIATTKKPSTGTIEYGIAKNKNEFKDFVSMQFQSTNYPEGYRVKDLVEFFHKAVPLFQRLSNAELEMWISDFGIDKFYNSELSSLSGGQQQRVNLFLSLIKQPKLLILDELSTGLDISIYEKVSGIIQRFIEERKITLILISHNLEEIKRLTNRIVVLNKGLAIADEPTEGLTKATYARMTKQVVPAVANNFKVEEDKVYDDSISTKIADQKNDLFVKYSKKEAPRNKMVLENLSKTYNVGWTFGCNLKLRNGTCISWGPKRIKKTVVDIDKMIIRKGERISIIGPNGSGKTTLCELISTVTKPTTGNIKYWFGKSNYEITSKIGMQFQQATYPEELTTKEVLFFFAKASRYSLTKNELFEAVDKFRLGHVINERANKLSGGERQRLNVLVALLKKPELLILDEISTGLDVHSINEITNYINDYLSNKEIKGTLILISHHAEEIAALTDKMYILKDGKLTAKYDVNKIKLSGVKKVMKAMFKEVK